MFSIVIPTNTQLYQTMPWLCETHIVPTAPAKLISTAIPTPLHPVWGILFSQMVAKFIVIIVTIACQFQE